MNKKQEEIWLGDMSSILFRDLQVGRSAFYIEPDFNELIRIVKTEPLGYNARYMFRENCTLPDNEIYFTLSDNTQVHLPKHMYKHEMHWYKVTPLGIWLADKDGKPYCMPVVDGEIDELDWGEMDEISDDVESAFFILFGKLLKINALTEEEKKLFPGKSYREVVEEGAKCLGEEPILKLKPKQVDLTITLDRETVLQLKEGMTPVEFADINPGQVFFIFTDNSGAFCSKTKSNEFEFVHHRADLRHANANKIVWIPQEMNLENTRWFRCDPIGSWIAYQPPSNEYGVPTELSCPMHCDKGTIIYQDISEIEDMDIQTNRMFQLFFGVSPRINVPSDNDVWIVSTNVEGVIGVFSTPEIAIARAEKALGRKMTESEKHKTVVSHGIYELESDKSEYSETVYVDIEKEIMDMPF